MISDVQLLFERFPGCSGLPRALLAKLPTPILHLKQLGDTLGVGGLYVKNDGVTGDPVGGNKVRKLEFLLGKALAQGAKTVLTFGGAGSNHAAATAWYARTLGLDTICVLADQPPARTVRSNLLLSHRAQARVVHCNDFRQMQSVAQRESQEVIKQTGRAPFVIPPGGSSANGTVGYVAAGFELAAQIARGELPCPDTIYGALGTCGTVVGLALGLAVAGVGCEIVGVRVVPASMANPARVEELGRTTSELLNRMDNTFPLWSQSGARVRIDGTQFGREYARFTKQAVESVEMAKEQGNLHLEGTYTGKAFAALVADARSGKLAGKNVLFVNTYNQGSLDPLLVGCDYHELPQPFHHYFTGPLQLLDR